MTDDMTIRLDSETYVSAAELLAELLGLLPEHASPSPLLREENINTTTLDMYLSTHRRSSTPTIDTPPSLCSLSIYLCLLS